MSARQKNACAFATVVLGVVLVLLLNGAPARAVSALTPWDGVNPFNCAIQDAGQGTKVPDPGADPYCVRFDKTNQNIAELGIVDFLSKEPARVAAALPKCFYYQEDHWRGSLIQSNQQTVVYEFYGHYFFNKATGDGGVWVTGFTVAGHTFDPRMLPGFPPQWDPYFGPGTGGVISHNDVPVDPSCVATASNPRAPIYAPPQPVAAPPAAARCDDVFGRVKPTGLGALRLGMSQRRVLATLGSPQAVKRGVLRYCLLRSGSLLVAERGRHPHTVFLSTTSPAFTLVGVRGRPVRVGAAARFLRAAFPHAKPLLKLGRTAVVQVLGPSHQPAAGRVLAGIIAGHVAYLVVYEPGVIRTARALDGYLRAAG